MKFAALAILGLFATTAMTPASAVPIGDGTVSVSILANPNVNLASAPATYTASVNNTFQISGTGAFANLSGTTGQMNGTLQFSSTVDAVITQNVANFFQFQDGNGGFYRFSVTSVTTQSYNNDPGVTSNVGLYLLGSTVDTLVNYDATPTSLTLTFNSTKNSSYSASATLAIPPSPTNVPEPLSLALLGTGVLAAGVVRRMTAKS